MFRPQNPPEKLSEDQIEELKEAFSLFDTNGDGTITSSELGTVLRSLGKNVSDAEVEELLKEVSVDHEGMIHFPDFVAMMSIRLRDFNSEDELKEAFRMFDRNGDGMISADELRLALQSFGEQLADEEIEELLREADINCDGQIDYQDFFASDARAGGIGLLTEEEETNPNETLRFHFQSHTSCRSSETVMVGLQERKNFLGAFEKLGAISNIN
ncbi:calmodulin-A-like isoform X1 [Aedes albopictus]|uniref:EF-hand domain-containing protein n=1 Tax=Aedes albopictus TaxID=7160 RepID=A0ABM1ZNP1_AEDAL